METTTKYETGVWNTPNIPPQQTQVTADPRQQYVTTSPYVQQPQQPLTTTVGSKALAAGVMGLVVVSTGTMGGNLHRVQDGEMTINEAVNDSLVKGAKGGIAAASASAASATFTSGGLAGLAVTLLAATGVSYLLNK